MGDDKSKGIILTNLRAADQFGRVVLPKEYVNAIGAPIENLRGALNESKDTYFIKESSEGENVKFFGDGSLLLLCLPKIFIDTLHLKEKQLLKLRYFTHNKTIIITRAEPTCSFCGTNNPDELKEVTGLHPLKEIYICGTCGEVIAAAFSK